MYAMVLALVCVWVIFTLLTGGTFLSTRNLSNLSRQAAVTAILAVGMTLVIVSANIDLSVGYGAGLLGAIAAIVHVWWGQPILVTLFIVICIGILMGLMQGYLVAYQRIPAFIVTLGGFLAYRGLMLAFTRGETILLPDNWLKAIGNAYLSPTLGWGLMLAGVGIGGFRFYRQRVAQLQYGNPEQASLLMFLLKIIGTSALIIVFIAVMNAHKGVPFPVCILFGLAFVFHFIANHTRFGRYVYAVGGNRRSGVPLRGQRPQHHVAGICNNGCIDGSRRCRHDSPGRECQSRSRAVAGVRRYRRVCYRRCKFNGWTRKHLRCNFGRIRYGEPQQRHEHGKYGCLMARYY